MQIKGKCIFISKCIHWTQWVWVTANNSELGRKIVTDIEIWKEISTDTQYRCCNIKYVEFYAIFTSSFIYILSDEHTTTTKNSTDSSFGFDNTVHVSQYADHCLNVNLLSMYHAHHAKRNESYSYTVLLEIHAHAILWIQESWRVIPI